MGETKHIQALHPNCFIFVDHLVQIVSFRRLKMFSNNCIFWQLFTYKIVSYVNNTFLYIRSFCQVYVCRWLPRQID
jgi:hypothetical protein